ncbi:DegT/DnrJ/EryC1/StrS family aminotransferase [Thermodesulfobacteriota bacterium]
MHIIPFTVPQFEWPALYDYVRAFFRNQWHEGNEIKRLEEQVARFIGVQHALFFASGRYALFLLYEYFGCRGKKVIVPAYTCIPAADAFRWAGADPFFVDIDPRTYNPQYDPRIQDLDDVGAVCLSYLYGLVSDPEEFIQWASSADVPVIEDAAIALGAKVGEKLVGSIGHAGVLSLQSSKIVTGWRGGVITTNDEKLFDFLRRHQQQQRSPSSLKLMMNGFLMAVLRLMAPPRIYSLIGYPLKRMSSAHHIAKLLEKLIDQNPVEAITADSPESLPPDERRRFTNPQAMLALASLERLDEILTIRRRNAAYLINGLKEITGVIPPMSVPGTEHAYGRFPVRIEGLDKNEAVKLFARNSVEIGVNYPYIIPDTPYFRGINSGNRDFPNAREAARETILLPFHTYLNIRDLDHIIAAVKRVAATGRRHTP